MQHESRAGSLEVDHFDPRRKKDVNQNINNLFPASRHVNGKKSNHWPNSEELKAGARFLNPCEEEDYGTQIFENFNTHLLFGATPAARWHIRMCGLNSEHLVSERRRRAEHLKRIETQGVQLKKDRVFEVIQLIEGYRSEVALMIPPIPDLSPV